MKKKVSIPLVLLGIISILVLNVPIIHFPINTPKYLANTDSKPSYIPFKDTKRYSTIVSCGRNCLEVNYKIKVVIYPFLLRQVRRVTLFGEKINR